MALKVKKKPVKSALTSKATVAGVELVTIPLKEYEELLRLRRCYGKPGTAKLLPPLPRSPIEIDREIADFLDERLGRMLLKEVYSAALEKFGKGRAPSPSAIHRYHMRHRRQDVSSIPNAPATARLSSTSSRERPRAPVKSR